MKVGDQVKIKDGSYMLTVKDGKLSHTGSSASTDVIGWCKDSFTIVATYCTLPADAQPVTRIIQNDTVIVNNSNGEIWFCAEKTNLSLFEPEIPAVELTVSEISKRLGYEVKIVK